MPSESFLVLTCTREETAELYHTLATVGHQYHQFRPLQRTLLDRVASVLLSSAPVREVDLQELTWLRGLPVIAEP